MSQPSSYIFPKIDINPTEQARGVVTHQEWNALMNSLLEQGNYTSEALQDVFQDLYTKSELASTTIGSDGARLIGIDSIPGITGTNVNEALRSLKEQINTTVLGSIPDGSITSAKLAQNLNFGGTTLKFNGVSLLTTSSIVNSTYTDDTDKAASARLVKSLSTGKQDKIPVAIEEPTESTPGTIYLQYII